MGELPFARLPGVGVADDELELGHVLGVFGVRGEVRLFLHHRESDLLSAPRDVVLVDPQGGRHAARLASRPGAGKRVLGRIEGVDDRELAASLQGWRVVVGKDALAPLEEGEFYVWQVEGATVRVGDRDVGEVIAVQHTAGPDVLVVRHGGDTSFVPCVKELVLDLDLDARVVTLAAEALDEGEA